VRVPPGRTPVADRFVRFYRRLDVHPFRVGRKCRARRYPRLLVPPG
jgi:hypothetical protein